MKQITITENEAGQRMDKLLKKYLQQAPKGFLYKMLRKKNIILNGKRAKGDEILVKGDEVTLFLAEDTIQKFSKEMEALHHKPAGNPLTVLYENEHVIIINKPAGLLAQKSAKEDISVNDQLLSYLLENHSLAKEELKTFRPSICNRLDRNTSGLMLGGKTLYGLQEVSKLLRERRIDKYYRCLVDGQVMKKQTIKGYLVKDDKTNKVSIFQEKVENAGYIETEYIPITVKENATLLEVKLITGRSHQIRAHLSHIGHPVIGDQKYGNRKINEEWKRRYHINDQLLHSYRMNFPDMTGELREMAGMEIKAKIPWKQGIGGFYWDY